jgi:very-short-patch-repair endonuclease
VTVRRRVLGPVDLVDHRGLAVTAPLLTVLEAALEMGDAGGPFLDRALQRWVSFPLVHSACCRDAGPRGSARAHRLLVAAADRAASAAERRLVGVVRREGLAGWVLNHRVDGVRVGVAFPGAAVAVEVDGWAWHTDANRVAHSDLRREMLVRLGWTVLRYTWAELVGQPEVLLADVARAIGAGGGWPRRP